MNNMAKLEIDNSTNSINSLLKESQEEREQRKTFEEKLAKEAMEKALSEKNVEEEVQAKAAEEAKRKEQEILSAKGKRNDAIVWSLLALLIASLIAIPFFLKSRSISSSDIVNDSNAQCINGEYVVDMGVDVLWRCSNLNTTSPSEGQVYFVCGETYPRDEDTSDWDIDAINAEMLSRKIYKGDGELPLSRDAAHSILGKGWRTPSEHDYEQLLAISIRKQKKCDGVKGVLLKSKINGHILFFPEVEYHMPYMTRTTATIELLPKWMDSSNVKEWGVGYDVDGAKLIKEPSYRGAYHPVRPVLSLND